MGESTTTKRDYRVMEEVDLAELVDRVCADSNLDLEGNVAAGVMEALEGAGVVLVPLEVVAAKNAEKAINAAARGIVVTETRTADLRATPAWNWTEAERTLRPGTEVS
jgi:hypothetical protein